MRIPWGQTVLGYLILVAITVGTGICYGRSAIGTVVVLAIATFVVGGLIVAKRLLPPRVRFWLISVMAAVFTIATIARIIVQLLRP